MRRHTDGTILIDGFKFTALGVSQDVMNMFHDELDRSVKRFAGEVTERTGDGLIASGFSSVDDAVRCALDVQRAMERFNERIAEKNPLRPMSVRIGVSLGRSSKPTLGDEGKGGQDTINHAGHLEKQCPPGRVMISEHVYKAMRTQHEDFRPGPFLRRDNMATYVSTYRSHVPGELTFRSSLTEEQRSAYPLIAFPDWTLLVPVQGTDLCGLPGMLQESFVILGETRPESRARFSPIDSAAATSDAVGAVEILAAVQASPDVCAGIDEWVDSEDQAVARNVVVVGSPVVNLYAHAVNTVFSPSASTSGPAGFETDPQHPFRILVREPHQSVRRFPERMHHSGNNRHYGLAILCQSPFNPEKTLLWVAGISGLGTQAVARFVHDMVRDSDRCLREKRLEDCLDVTDPTVAVLEPAAQGGLSIGDYVKGGWRVSDYSIVWLGRPTAPTSSPNNSMEPDK